MLNLEIIKKRLEELPKDPQPHVCEMCGFVTPCICPQWDEILWHDAELDKKMDEQGI